jgi:hypothetical protein
MKALAILSSVPDIVFFTADDEYLDQLDAFAERQGMQQVCWGALHSRTLCLDEAKFRANATAAFRDLFKCPIVWLQRCAKLSFRLKTRYNEIDGRERECLATSDDPEVLCS